VGKSKRRKTARKREDARKMRLSGARAGADA